MERFNDYQGDIWIFLHPRSKYSTNTCFILPLLTTNQHNLNGVASQKPTLGEQNKESERLRHSSTQNTSLSVTTPSHLPSLPERPSLLQAEFPAWSGAAAPRSPAAASDRTQRIKKVRQMWSQVRTLFPEESQSSEMFCSPPLCGSTCDNCVSLKLSCWFPVDKWVS